MTLSVSRSQALTLLAAGAVAAPLPVRAQAAPIRFGSSPTADSYQIPYYAAEAGFFKRAGLNVEMFSFPNAGAIGAAMAGGALDIAHVDPVLVANAFNRSVPWAFFAGGGTYATEAPTTVLCALPNSPVKTGKDLEGKAVGVVSLASISALGVKAWIESTGGDLSKIKLFELSYATMVPALQRGDLGAAFLAEPFLSEYRKELRVVANAYDAIAKSFLICATFTARAFVAQNAALLKRVAQVLDETVRWANTHHDESAIISAKETGLAVEKVNAMTRVRYAELDPRLLQPVLDAAFKYKSIEKPVAAADIVARV